MHMEVQLNILIIDENCNAVDFARHLARHRRASDQVFLSTDGIDCHIWAEDGLNFCPVFDCAIKARAFIDANAITAVCNFSSYLANSGFIEQLELLGVRCTGTDLAFAKTEYNKGAFKKWMLRHEFSTPKIILETFIDAIAVNADTFSFPIVIKPSVQTGPSTRVCYTPEDLRRYVGEVDAALGQGKRGIVYLLEQYVAPEHVISIEYYLVDGNAIIEVTSVFHSVKKGGGNSLGITCAQSPFPDFSKYEEQCLSLLSSLSEETTHAARGHLEAIVDKDGQLLFMENNARPPACMIWHLHIKDPWLLVRGLIESDASLVSAAFVRACDDPNRSLVVPLLQTDATIEVDLEALYALQGVSISPFSMEHRGGGFVASSKKMPSLLSATSTSFESAHIQLSAAIEQLKKHYNFHLE
jgi:hypothetical protein